MAKTSSYYLYERFEKRGDQDWIPSHPNVFSKDGDGTMPLVVRIEKDYECGWHCDPEYQWIELPITDYLCDECGELGQVTHKWALGDGYLCEGTSKYQKLVLNVDVGNGWEEVVPMIAKPGELIEEKSTDCGYQNPRMRATLADGTIKEVPYAFLSPQSPTYFLNSYDIMHYGIPISQIKEAEFYGGELYDDTFAGCQTLTSVTFHNKESITATTRGGGYFFGSGIKNFTGKVDFRPESSFTFANCKNLTSFTVTNETYNDGLSGLARFANCTGLTSIDVSLLGMYGQTNYAGGGGEACYLFGNCTNLRTAKVALSLPEYGGYARNLIPMGCFDNCTSLTDVEIFCGFWYNDELYGWTRFGIGDRAFYNCRSLTSITMSYHSEDVAPDEYYILDCFTTSGVTETKIGNVGSFAFYGCAGLRSIKLDCTDNTDPQTVTSAYIGDYAFYGCTGLTEVILDEVVPPSLGTGAFDNTTCVINVPAISVNTYKQTEGWSQYASRIQAIQ